MNRSAAVDVPETGYVSAHERLKSFPPIFRGSDMTLRFQWTSKQASHYLWLWNKRGLIKSLGGHSDVHFNLVKDENIDLEAGLLMARPSAVIVGIECLRRAGWTTQIPARADAAIDSTFAKFESEFYVIHSRSDRWYRWMADGIHRQPKATTRVAPSLRPAWALADMLKREGWFKCGLAPDDIEWDDVDARDRGDWLRACEALRLPPDSARPLLATPGAKPLPRASSKPLPRASSKRARPSSGS